MTDPPRQVQRGVAAAVRAHLVAAAMERAAVELDDHARGVVAGVHLVPTQRRV